MRVVDDSEIAQWKREEAEALMEARQEYAGRLKPQQNHLIRLRDELRLSFECLARLHCEKRDEDEGEVRRCLGSDWGRIDPHAEKVRTTGFESWRAEHNASLQILRAIDPELAWRYGLRFRLGSLWRQCDEDAEAEIRRRTGNWDD